jgi:hypothetical protein
MPSAHHTFASKIGRILEVKVLPRTISVHISTPTIQCISCCLKPPVQAPHCANHITLLFSLCSSILHLLLNTNLLRLGFHSLEVHVILTLLIGMTFMCALPRGEKLVTAALVEGHQEMSALVSHGKRNSCLLDGFNILILPWSSSGVVMSSHDCRLAAERTNRRG